MGRCGGRSRPSRSSPHCPSSSSHFWSRSISSAASHSVPSRVEAKRRCGAPVMPVLFSKVTKKFADGTLALDALDLEFELGEFIVLLGPSVSGKTTACRLLAGLETPTEGRIEVD